jgi:hexosaminidase
MKLNATLFILFILFSAGHLYSQSTGIIPQPTETVIGKGTFTFNANTSIYYTHQDPALRVSVQPLIDKMLVVAGYPLKTTAVNPGRNIISVSLRSDMVDDGGYELEVLPASIEIRAKDAVGVFYAVQSLLQLLPAEIESGIKVPARSWQIPSVTIRDAPAFRYRGLMIDVSRHFMPISFLRRLVDLMSMQKMNNLHLHLTDDQGWRIEIKKYPKLTSTGSVRSGTIQDKYAGKGNDNTEYRGFYSQDEMKELVAYAAKKYINIVPEIELPGHSSAAIAAYPALGCFPDESSYTADALHSKAALEKVKVPGTKIVQESWGVFNDVLCPTEFTFNFMQDVLDEVISIFPSKYIHIGGDECPKEFWKRSSFCQELILK